jgi:hypothetical protein
MTPPIERPECRDALSWLQCKLDGATVPMSDAVSAHVRGCDECRGRFRAADRLLQVLSLKPEMQRLPAERIVLAVQRDQRRQRVGRWVAATAAIAAALVLGVWLAARPTADPGLSELAKAPSLRRDAAEATDAIVAIGQRTAEQTLGESRLFIPKVELPPIAASALSSAAAPINDAGKGLIDGLEPVTSSARRAIGMFMKDGGDRKNN